MDNQQWWIIKREFADGRVAYVYPLTFDRARIGISRDVNDKGFENLW